MGAQTAKCCCREDLEAEKINEGSGKVPSSLITWDQEMPLYDPSQADSFEGSGHRYHGLENDGDTFAPPPEDAPGSADLKQEPPSEDKKDKAKSNGSTEQPKKEKKEAPAPDKEQLSSTYCAKAEALPHCLTDVPANSAIEEKRDDPALLDKVYGFTGMTLQIQLDNGWSDFAEDDLKQINNHLKAGTKLFTITIRGAMYAIDFRDPGSITQTNPTTRKVRNLRLVSESGEALKSENPTKAANEAPKNATSDAAKDAKQPLVVSPQQKGKCCVIS
jgi:hypothetical protein